jgi:gluconolactonase
LGAIAPAIAHSTPSEVAHFAIYDDAFAILLGPEPNIKLAVEQDWPFAHEAGVYVPSQDVVFVTSDRLGSDDSPNVKISRVSRDRTGTWTSEEVPADVVMGNGGINYEGGILFCAQGSKSSRSGLVHMDPTPPFKTRTLLDNFHGLAFNSMNDVVVHTDGGIWFTDPIYGFEQGFRHRPELPNQIYRFDPVSGDLRVTADNFGRPNGICFAPDERTLYITDTDWAHGDGTVDDTRPRAM